MFLLFDIIMFRIYFIISIFLTKNKHIYLNFTKTSSECWERNRKTHNSISNQMLYFQLTTITFTTSNDCHSSHALNVLISNTFLQIN